ncbi:TipC family immunity protein, partial [Streptococcus acidominimus]
IVLFWYMIIYTSLKNPIDEMLYSEITRFKIVDLPRYSEVINSDTSYDLRGDGGFISLSYNLNNLQFNERVSIYVSNLKTYLFIYDLSLKNGKSLIITYKYDRTSFLRQNIYLTDGDESKIEDLDIIFEYLSENQLDKEWLKNKSEIVLHDILLKPWFEKGSQRYSFENLGNLKIEESTLLK